jgi:hypothetical protein
LQQPTCVDLAQALAEPAQIRPGVADAVGFGDEQQHVIGGPQRGDRRARCGHAQMHLAMPDPIDGADSPDSYLVSDKSFDTSDRPRHQARGDPPHCSSSPASRPGTTPRRPASLAVG